MFRFAVAEQGHVMNVVDEMEREHPLEGAPLGTLVGFNTLKNRLARFAAAHRVEVGVQHPLADAGDL